MKNERRFVNGLLGIVCLLSFTIVCSGFAQEGTPKKARDNSWKIFTSKGGGVQFLAPGAVRDGSEKVETALGTMTMHFHQASATPERLFCMVSYASYPEKIMEGFNIKTGLDGARDQAMANLKAKLTKEKEISLSGHPGRHLEFDFQTPDKQQITGKARIYFVKNKLLQQLVFYVAKDGLEPKVTRFLDSLSLLTKAKK